MHLIMTALLDDDAAASRTQLDSTNPRHVPDLILVSHRGPVPFSPEDAPRPSDTAPAPGRQGGGLVTALRDLVRNAARATWVCAGEASAPGSASRVDPKIDADLGCAIEIVEIDPERHHEFYAIVANPILWFVQHGLWNLANTPDFNEHEHRAWHHGYVAVNEAFAHKVTEVAARSSPDALLMLHDYHFYLVPEQLRRAGVRQVIHYFVHIPWPNPDNFRVLPSEWRRSILHGLLGADIIAFHTDRYAKNFLATCNDLLGLDVDTSRGTVRYQGRDVAVRFYPISVDPESLAEIGRTRASARHERELELRRRQHLMLRVDRVDPSKNILRGFRAFARMLEQHPELLETVTFLALLQPSREDVPEYVKYRADIEWLVERINTRFETPTWIPIDLRITENLPLAVAAYALFDVLVVNAVADGMNLVAKEALVVNRRDGVLALSENTGAHAELEAIAVTLHPFDIEQQAAAFWEALTMAPEDRRARHDAGVDIVRTNNVAKWLGHQLADVRALHHDSV
jgi:trehalose 6-phosphate synthase